jgi:lysozyme
MTAASEQLYRLLRRFEQGPGGGPALKAYLCPAGKWTLAYGCTKHPDGSPVREGDTITEDQVYLYTEAAVERVRSDLRRIVKRPLNPYQEAAIGSLIFNLGGEALRVSERLLPTIESGRWEDAAEVLSEYYRAWGKKNGKWHRMAMYGLRIRRLAEGCVMNGLDWEDACQEQNIAFPRTLEWQPDWTDGKRTGGRYFDVVDLTEATPYSSIHARALAHPLPKLQAAPAPIPAPAIAIEPPAAPVMPDAKAGQPGPDKPPSPPAPAAPAPVADLPPPKPIPASPGVPSVEQNSAKSTAEGGAGASGPVAPAPSVPEKPKAPVAIAPKTVDINAIPYGAVDPANGAKNMTDSKRFVGMVIVAGGSLVQVLAAREVVSSTAGAIFFDLSRDPIIVALAAGGVLWLIGHLTRKRGQKVITDGMVSAQHLLK